MLEYSIEAKRIERALKEVDDYLAAVAEAKKTEL